MDEALVSIALCTYNGERFIAGQLESILNQTHSNLEILVCDDGSSDATLSIIRSYRDPRVRIVENEKNLGLEANFFKAIAHCTGNYIALSDQDDLWYPSKIETLLAHIGHHTLIYADSRFVDEGGNAMNKKLSGLRRMYCGSDPRVFSLNYLTCLFGHALLFSKDLQPLLSGQPGISHDAWIGFIAATNGSIGYIDEVLVDYRQHTRSVTRQSQRPDNEVFKTSLLLWFSALEKHSGQQNKIFFSNLLSLYKTRRGLGMIRFLSFLAVHSESVFYTKPGFFSRFNLLRKLYQKTGF